MSIPKKQATRNHIFYEVTRSLCPVCRKVIDAQVLLRDNKVYLRKHCPDHGWHEALVSTNVDYYVNSLKYNKPGAIPNDFATDVDKGCPHDCGLCPEHQQHTCIGIIEITNRCNLTCPICFADSGINYDLSVKQVEAILDRLMETEDRPEVIQLSGGEPTIHPQIIDIIKAAKDRNIEHVMINTNGLRIANEPDFVRELAEYKPTIYLQFDGLNDKTYKQIRGRDLLSVKKRALDNIANAGMNAVLVASIAQGINVDEIGDILRYGLAHPAVRGVCYQPITYSGRCAVDQNPLDRATLTGVIDEIEKQTDGLFKTTDFIPMPCPHPVCSASTIAFVDGQEVIPIPRIINVDDYLDFITNRSTPNITAELQPAFETLWSMSLAVGSEKMAQSLECVACGINLPANLIESIPQGSFMWIHVHGFMDEHTFDIKRLMKCCVHQLLPDGRAVPFCAYNNLPYREQVKQSMADKSE
jgi:uncharacterized radical SAM superfamily Fe-S cluster-containing enzyme